MHILVFTIEMQSKEVYDGKSTRQEDDVEGGFAVTMVML